MQNPDDFLVASGRVSGLVRVSGRVASYSLWSRLTSEQSQNIHVLILPVLQYAITHVSIVLKIEQPAEQPLETLMPNLCNRSNVVSTWQLRRFFL